MKCALALLDGYRQSVLEHLQIAVVGELEVVHTSHDTGQVIVWGVGGFAWAADNGKNGGEALETCGNS